MLHRKSSSGCVPFHSTVTHELELSRDHNYTESYIVNTHCLSHWWVTWTKIRRIWNLQLNVWIQNKQCPSDKMDTLKPLSHLSRVTQQHVNGQFQTAIYMETSKDRSVQTDWIEYRWGSNKGSRRGSTPYSRAFRI